MRGQYPRNGPMRGQYHLLLLDGGEGRELLAEGGQQRLHGRRTRSGRHRCIHWLLVRKHSLQTCKRCMAIFGMEMKSTILWEGTKSSYILSLSCFNSVFKQVVSTSNCVAKFFTDAGTSSFRDVCKPICLLEKEGSPKYCVCTPTDLLDEGC